MGVRTESARGSALPAQEGASSGRGGTLLAPARAAGLGFYLLVLTLGRHLSHADYGELIAALALAYILWAARAVLQGAVGAISSWALRRKKACDPGRAILQRLLLVLLLAESGALVATRLGVALAYLLRMERPLSVALLEGYLGLFLFLVLARGIMEAWERYHPLGKGLAKELLILFGAGVALALVGLNVDSAYPTGYLLALLWLLLALLPALSRPAQAASPQSAPGIAVMAAKACLMAMVGLDILAVKAFAHPTAAGFYAAAATLGKIAFLPAWGMAGGMLLGGAGHRGEARRTLIWCGAPALALALAYIAFPRQVLGWAFGGKYLAAAGLLGPLGIASLLCSLNLALLTYHLALGQTRVLRGTLAFLATEMGLLALHGAQPFQAVATLILASAGLLAYLAFYTWASLQEARQKASLLEHLRSPA